MTTINTQRFRSLGGRARRYLDLQTGNVISRRQAIKLSTGLSPEALAVQRAASEPRPKLEQLTNRLKSMLGRGFTADDIAIRTRTYERVSGRGARKLELGDRVSHELLSPGTVRGVARGRAVVSEQRAEAILRALDNPAIDFSANVIGRDGQVHTIELVSENDVHKYFRYYNALEKLARGDSSKFDSLKPSDFEVEIVGPRGKVERYRLNDNKAQLIRELKRGRLTDLSLPSPETKRGRS